MDTSPWDIADIFRLHEAACLIAGVLPLSKRVSDREELPAQAIPIFGKLGSAYVLNWAAHHKNLPEDPKNPKEKRLKGIDEIPTLPKLQSLKKLTGELVSREELHRWVKAMGIKSAYSFAPVAEMDASNAEYSFGRQTKLQEIVAKMGDPAHQQYIAAADAVVNRVANAEAELDDWEKSDDRDIPSEKRLRNTQIAKAKQEKKDAEASLNQMRGDFPGEPDATPETVANVAKPASDDATCWLKAPPQRMPGYRWPLYKFLKAAYDAGKPCPKAKDVLDAWKLTPPPGVIVIQKGRFELLEYELAIGGTKTADLKAVQAAISDLIVRTASD